MDHHLDPRVRDLEVVVGLDDLDDALVDVASVEDVAHPAVPGATAAAPAVGVNAMQIILITRRGRSQRAIHFGALHELWGH